MGNFGKRLLGGIVNTVKGMFSDEPIILHGKPTPTPSAMPTPTPTAIPMDVGRMQKMIQVYGGQDAPLMSYAQQLTDAQRYPIFKHNPELLPLISQLETSSGRNVTRPNNMLNWGINYPGNNEEFSKMTFKDVLEKAISGLGERSPYYSKFRVDRPLTDEELLDFAKIYEPANGSYGPNLISGRKTIREKLK